MRNTLILLVAFFALGQPVSFPAVCAEEVSFSGSLKIVAILWEANPKSAAKTLASTIERALERKQLTPLVRDLGALDAKTQSVVEGRNTDDARFIASLSTRVLLQDGAALRGEIERACAERNFAPETALVFRSWFAVNSEEAFGYFENTLAIGSEQTIARPLLDAALDADRVRAGKVLIANWQKLTPAMRLAVIEPLTATRSTMKSVVDAVQAGEISKDLVNPNQLRKWLTTDENGDSAEDSIAELEQAIQSIWGTIRSQGDSQRPQLVAETLKLLNSGVSGSVARGEKTFARVCAQCHQLHGQGYEVGPNISGNGRGSLAQLVSNVLDPSLVIGEAFQAKTILTEDDEIVAGLVVAENDRYLKLKVQGGKVIEFDKEEDIVQIKTSEKSLMPEGVEAQMTEQELIDLFAYLCLLKPLNAENNELIPGTPENLVNP